MKHIKRKFLFHEFLRNYNVAEHSEKYVPKEKADQNFLKKTSKNNFAILETDQNEKVFSFIYNNSGTQTLIPVPDFALVNYDFAYKLNIERIKLKKDLVKNLSDLKQGNEVSNSYAYDFYGNASSCLICLFTSVECFINDIIPEDFVYKIENLKKTEIYNKAQIQYSISFNDKITKVLPQALGKNYFSKPTPKNTHIHNLRDLRNELIHSKSDKTGKTQVDNLKKLLNFKYDETFKSIFDFFNFYRENYIEECPCENNW